MALKIHRTILKKLLTVTGTNMLNALVKPFTVSLSFLLLLNSCEPEQQAASTAIKSSNFVGGEGVPPATIELIDLNEQVAAIQNRELEQADTSLTYYASGDSTVHMHVLSRRQITPLHLHKQADELTVIISGRPLVTQLNVADNEIVAEQREYPQFTLVSSPAYCGHEWENISSAEVQANLVFAMPTFNGNFYVRDDDPQLLQCSEAVAWETQGFQPTDNSEAVNFIVEPAADTNFGSRMRFHRNQGEYVLDTSASAAVVLFVGGIGFLQTSPPTQVMPGQLLLVPKGFELAIAGTETDPVEFYSFLPELP